MSFASRWTPPGRSMNCTQRPWGLCGPPYQECSSGCRATGSIRKRHGFASSPCSVRPSRSASHARRSEEHTSELQSLMRISYAVFCLKKKNDTQYNHSYRNKTYIKQTHLKHQIHIYTAIHYTNVIPRQY